MAMLQAFIQEFPDTEALSPREVNRNVTPMRSRSTNAGPTDNPSAQTPYTNDVPDRLGDLIAARPDSHLGYFAASEAMPSDFNAMPAQVAQQTSGPTSHPGHEELRRAPYVTSVSSAATTSAGSAVNSSPQTTYTTDVADRDVRAFQPLLCERLRMVHLGIESEQLQSVVTALRAPNLSDTSLDIPSQTCIKLLLKCAEFVRPATTLLVRSYCLGIADVKQLYASMPFVRKLDIRRSRGCYCAAVNLHKPTWPGLNTLRLRDPSFPNLRNLFGVGPRIIPELRLLEILYTQQILLTVEEEDWVRWNVQDLNLALEEDVDWWISVEL
ncbi:hypothetical protein K438DRAFT_1749257 [Mycena galopus ATCC 62051]|nr:hypothetical protein K438DRAFT_1749257 [Mycena galopus ATCC 62051]